MAEKYFLCVIEKMDRLWFHQIIFFSQPSEKKPVPTPLSLESLSCPSSMLSSLPHDENSTDESPTKKQVSPQSHSDAPQDGSTNNNKDETKERLARMNVLCERIRSHSSPPSSSQQSRRKFRKTCAAAVMKKVLQKSMSCRTMGELELDEVKGFMDLGFIFKKETLSPRMMRVVPGLHRLGLHQDKQSTQQMDATIQADEDSEAEEQKKRDITRPYLSEAWLIKRPDSPLLSLKVPKACTATNMKKHLRFWAKTVASEIHQQ